MPNTREKAAEWFAERAKNTPMPGTREMFEIAADALRENPVQQWISVNDRLPEPFTSVLAYVPSEAPLPLVHESYFVDAPQVWVCIIEKQPWKQGAVTHWMPLPEPPKGE